MSMTLLGQCLYVCDFGQCLAAGDQLGLLQEALGTYRDHDRVGAAGGHGRWGVSRLVSVAVRHHHPAHNIQGHLLHVEPSNACYDFIFNKRRRLRSSSIHK